MLGCDLCLSCCVMNVWSNYFCFCDGDVFIVFCIVWNGVLSLAGWGVNSF